MAHVLIVGKSFSGIKSFLIENNHTYTVLQDEEATKHPEKRLRNRVVTSFKDDSFLETAKLIHRENTIDACITIYENYILANAIIAESFGLPGLSREAALACSDKEIMRTKFALSSEKVSPDFHVVQSEKSLIDFADTHDFPLILKPANLSKSLLVTKNNTIEELLTNYHKAMELADQTYKKYAPNHTPKFIVEEFLEGSIHSVDAFVDTNGTPYVLENVVDYQTGHDIGYDDNFHYSRLLPSQLPAEKVEAIRHTAALGCRLLGMSNSPAHIEIILTADGPRIVEIGARNGGYRERMHRLANNIDIIANTLALSLDKPLNITATKNDHVGVFELFPKTPGIFTSIRNEDKLRSLASLSYLSVKVKPGQHIGKAGDGHKMCAVVILCNSNANAFKRDMEYLNAEVEVLTSD